MASYSAMSGMDISGAAEMRARCNCPDVDDGAEAVEIAPAS
jgi:hypothetical protein